MTSTKSKFQVSRCLDDRIKKIFAGSSEYEDFSQLENAYLLGFNYGTVTNYVGLTSDIELHDGGCQIVGIVLFKPTSDDAQLKSKLKLISNHVVSSNGFGSYLSDKNKNLFLIYEIDTGTNPVSRRVYDTEKNAYLDPQPKISVLDSSKIYNHSALTRVSLKLDLDIFDKPSELAKIDKINQTLAQCKSCFTNQAKDLKLHLLNSNYSINGLPTDNKVLTETLYDSLDPPVEVLQMGDYLPQMSKSDKENAIEKWRNKVKSQRLQLEFAIEHDGLSVTNSTTSDSTSSYTHNLEFYIYLHVNDTISKSMESILFVIRRHFDLLQLTLISKLANKAANNKLEPDELKCCTFKPYQVDHLVHNIYPIASNSEPDFDNLAIMRKNIHSTYLLPVTRPLFRYSQRILNLNMKSQDEIDGYLCNVHSGIVDSSVIKGGFKSVIEGTYTYHHYMQMRIDDNGWGCAYRSLQTIISWFKHQGYIYSQDVVQYSPKQPDSISELRKKLAVESRVPKHEEIQTVLVELGDKQASFLGSKKWIGSQEICYVLNHLYGLDSKFINVSSGSELTYKARDLGQHFSSQSTPIMIGGGVLAHTIIGVDFNEKNGDTGYLILDPHYTGSEDLATITKKSWCGWKKNSFWDKSAFYNLCLPQRPIAF